MFSNNLLAFILREPRLGQTAVIYSDYVRLYLRNTFHHIPVDSIKPLVRLSAITIASIDISIELQNKGIGMNLIEVIHNFHKNQVTIVECVGNPILIKALVRRGWISYEANFNGVYEKDFIDCENPHNSNNLLCSEENRNGRRFVKYIHPYFLTGDESLYPSNLVTTNFYRLK